MHSVPRWPDAAGEGAPQGPQTPFKRSWSTPIPFKRRFDAAFERNSHPNAVSARRGVATPPKAPFGRAWAMGGPLERRGKASCDAGASLEGRRWLPCAGASMGRSNASDRVTGPRYS